MTDDERGKLDTDGYLVIERLMDESLLDQVRQRVEELFAQEGARAGAEFKQEPHSRRLANLVDKGEIFQVVALDENSGTIELQEFDGGIDEVDLDEWHQLTIDAAAQPEDWGGPLDDVEPDEFGYTDLDEGVRPVNPVETATMTWEQVVEEDDQDDVAIH